jgi:hypothetical protein
MQLISRIVTTGDLNSVLDWGITAEDFLTNEGRAIFNHILGYYSRADTAGSVIGPQVMQQIYPYFQVCDDPGMRTEALCKEVRLQRLAIEGSNRMDEIREMMNVDPVKAIGQMGMVALDLQNVGIGKNNDMSLAAGMDKVVTRYELLESGVDLSCGKWPWEILNEKTGGFQPEDYIVIYGRPKSFKSWALAFIIASIFDQGRRALIYTKEMTQENIFMRVIACIAQINYDGLRLGHLSPHEKYALYSARSYMNALQNGNNVFCLSGRDTPDGGDTVPWLRSKIEKYKPDFVFIDGMYLMSDVKNAKKDHARVRNISRALSELRLDLKIPIICTLQANREAAKHQEANLDEIAFSDAIGQDATCIIRIINEKDSPTCQLVLGGAREYALNGFRINAVPAYDFRFHSLLTAKEIEKAKRQDEQSEDNPDAHAREKKKRNVTESQAVRGAMARIDRGV